ncbi:MAG: peptidase M10A and M12B matrixin and adamalysin [Haloarculaceae archaeon]
MLGGVGAALSVGFLGDAIAAPDGQILVRVWASDRAAERDGLEPRVRGYLHAALDPVVEVVGVQFSERTVSLPAETGREVLSQRWPRIVAEGAAGLRELDPIAGVNLLVTDGDPRTRPAGFARPQVAATTGAKQLAAMPPADEAPAVVRYSVRAAATQLLLHECGHALGLSHDHGSANAANDAVVASPMVSSYLWKSEKRRTAALDGPTNACGEGYPPPDAEGERFLRMRYADCARRALRSMHE